ncbi:phage tail assembly chaperone [Sphingomonas sp. BGYR3]|uniref:phage tail assembly chaperone n=1 Tax=Sphingomonas sp. BGYR3 TaxID=2975483 RepID=UPI0021A2AF9D|nr:phage tail assembly chaperone [Sphingomonas sp. BGYR3]MDG5489131.1 phage tail assembly chaperone [Sphingomonas sp. BGYR3]
MMGAAFGWSPDAFWRATPDEVAALVEAARGEDAGAGVDRDTLARLMKEHPDG